MCSIGEDDFGDDGGVHAMIPDIKTSSKDNQEPTLQLCNKCKNPGAEYKLAFREAECRDCFLLYARHKFRAALGSSKILPKDAKVILVFDGSAESVVLLDMLHHAQTQNTFKRLHCSATVLYIDDYQLVHGTSKTTTQEYEEFLEKLQKFLSNYEHFNSYIMPMIEQQYAAEAIFPFNTIKDEYFLRDTCKEQTFISAINSIKSLTSRQDFVKHHRSKLIATIAQQFQCKFAFMPDISSDLASDLLAAVALGRGGSAALDVALVDDRLGNDIKLIRPLKDLNIMEIELYLKAQDLETQQPKRYGLDMASMASLQNLTKSFVDNLQQNFSSTVSTVFRTGDKISANQDVSTRFKNLHVNCVDNLESNELNCSFCNSLLDYQDSTTLLAIEFSRLVSESGCTLDKCPDLNLKAKQNVNGSKERPYLKKLCHACRNICLESSNENLLM